MGVFCKVCDTILDRTVELLSLPQYLTTSNPREKESFYHEAKAAAGLTHVSIAVVFEISEHENPTYLPQMHKSLNWSVRKRAWEIGGIEKRALFI